VCGQSRADGQVQTGFTKPTVVTTGFGFDVNLPEHAKLLAV
jgi:hypothetical protein